MKCPKCGSELDTGFNCPKCKAKSYKEIVSEYNTNGEKIYEKNTIKLVQPEPTTAEMLLWLIKNIPLDCDTQSIAFAFGWKEVVFDGDIDNQIKQAYNCAKQEEQNA